MTFSDDSTQGFESLSSLLLFMRDYDDFLDSMLVHYIKSVSNHIVYTFFQIMQKNLLEKDVCFKLCMLRECWIYVFEFQIWSIE